MTNDAKAVAVKHGTSPEMIFKNYRAVMRKASATEYFQHTRANIVRHLRGLIPDEELDAWQLKYPATEKSPQTVIS